MKTRRSSEISLSHENRDQSVSGSAKKIRFEFRGAEFDSYQEMVEAKRQFNHEKLQETGLFDIKNEIIHQKRNFLRVQTIKGKKKENQAPVRKSSRLAGIQVEEIYIEDETRGQVKVLSNSAGKQQSNGQYTTRDSFTKDRVCPAGESLSLEDAVEFAINDRSIKWVDTSIEDTKALMSSLPKKSFDGETRSVNTGQFATLPRNTTMSVIDVDSTKVVECPSVSNEKSVAKVTIDRIYSIACHPSHDKLLVSAGDKQGYLGIWNVESRQVHLLRPHGRPINHLEWNEDGTNLYSISYDSSVRVLDVERQMFNEVFATYKDDSSLQKFPGFKMDQGHSHWIQHGCLTPRQQGMWVCMSSGEVLHIDFRSKPASRITQQAQLSNKKINTVSLHEHSLATAGLDTLVQVWDARNFSRKGSRESSRNQTKPCSLAALSFGKSVNSAFFSKVGGTKLLVTTMSNTVDIFDARNISTNDGPKQSITHNNQTGRWLTTFQAQWHPKSDEMFAVGCLAQPRRIDLFVGQQVYQRMDVSGEFMTSVVSRCCFHPNSQAVILCGGNSSGRITVAR